MSISISFCLLPLFLGDWKLYLSSKRSIDCNFRVQPFPNGASQFLPFFPDHVVGVYSTRTLLPLLSCEGAILLSSWTSSCFFLQRAQGFHQGCDCILI